MATLLSAVSSNGAGTGASHSGPATVFVRGTFDGATVVIETSDDNSTYVKADNVSVMKPTRFTSAGCCNIEAKGTYYIRAVVSDAGGSTSITAVTTQ